MKQPATTNARRGPATTPVIQALDEVRLAFVLGMRFPSIVVLDGGVELLVVVDRLFSDLFDELITVPVFDSVPGEMSDELTGLGWVTLEVYIPDDIITVTCCVISTVV